MCSALNFTPAQKTAIDAKNCSLLVAAGAGSGKTRVLTERIIKRLLDEENPTDITKFLVVTFTNAAAKELSERIRRALTDKSLEGNNKRITKNLALLPQAKIRTIDAFCYDLVKEHFQKLSLPPKLRIADTTETEVLLDRIIEEIIEEKLENGGDFYTLYELFSGKKSDEPFSKTVKDVYNKLLNLPSMERYLKSVCEYYDEIANCREIFDTCYGKKLEELARETFGKGIERLEKIYAENEESDEFHAKLGDVLESDITNLKILLGSVKSGVYENCLYSYSSMKFANKPARLEGKSAGLAEARKDALQKLKDICSEMLSCTSDVLKKCAKDCYTVSRELSDVILKAHKRFADVKRDNGMLTFSDVKHFTLALLYNDTESGEISDIAKNLAESFDELYIDEYQDIDPVQDMIFLALTKKDESGFENNRFLVGDSKQSIYRFRGARPEIFNRYRKEFSDISDDLSCRKKLFMKNNFRCSENVIRFTNMLFSDIMADNYTKDDHLVYSKPEDIKSEKRVKIIVGDGKMLEDNKSAFRLEAEAQMLFDEIVNVLSDKTLKCSDGERYKLSDIAVLTPTNSDAAYLERFFNEKGLPAASEQGESFFERKEIRLAMNLLGCIDNPHRDIDTVGVMRSAIGAFGDDELTEIRLNSKTGSFYSAVVNYVESKNADEVISGKIKAFTELLARLRAESRCNTASDFIRCMYDATDLVGICTSKKFSPAGKASATSRKKNLLLLYEKAREYDKTVFRGLADFLDYLNTLKTAKDQMKSAADVSSDALRVMTVHKSKGLEFPVCFLFNAARTKTKSGDSLVMSENHGLAFRLRTLQGLQSVSGQNGFVSVSTPFKELVQIMNEREEKQEKKRVLYVALTRARDILCITAFPESLDKLFGAATTPDGMIEDSKSDLALIMASLAKRNGFLKMKDEMYESTKSGVYTFSDDEGASCVEVHIRTNTANEEVKETADVSKEQEDLCGAEADEELFDRIKQSLEQRKSALSKIVNVPPKITVSALKHGLIEYDDTENTASKDRILLEMPEFIREISSKSAAEKGTAMHTFLQFAVFSNCENGNCENEAMRLKNEGFITERQYGLLDINKLNAFFETLLYNDIKNAKNVYREMRFNLKTDAKEVISDVPETDDFVLVQGVIDCFIENADGSFTVIDFKTDRIYGESAEKILAERYSGQLHFYCKAVEDITKKKVSRAVIFSFDTMECIELGL